MENTDLTLIVDTTAIHAAVKRVRNAEAAQQTLPISIGTGARRVTAKATFSYLNLPDDELIRLFAFQCMLAIYDHGGSTRLVWEDAR